MSRPELLISNQLCFLAHRLAAGRLVADEADYLDIRERLEGMLSRLDSSATCSAGSDRAG
jgi:hypothetical protein